MRKLRPLLPSIILLSLLAGCLQLSGPSGDANLNLNGVNMIGITEATVQITAEGAWTLDTGERWLSASPSKGTGNASVTLTVDPDGLTPAEYTTSITLKPQDFPEKTTTVNFAFPKLRGSIVMGPAGLDSPSLLSAQSIPGGPGTLFVGLREPASMASNGFAANAVGFATKASSFRSLAADVASRGGSMRLRAAHPNSRVAVLDVDDMRAAKEILERDPNVRYVEPEGHLELLASNDPGRIEQWALDVIEADSAWDIGDGTGVRVAVIDAGFHPDHIDLFDNVEATYDFISNGEVITDRQACGSHGDHVAGILAAVTNNAKGVAGTAPGARMSLLNVGDEVDGACPISTNAVVAALEWVIGDQSSGGPRADVVNMSLGGGHWSPMEDAVKAAYVAGITIVAAAGNSASGPVLFPAAYPQVIAVSATGKSDEIASYSTTGQQIFVGAPGGNEPNYILSTIYDYDNPQAHQYGYMAGTSMASPAVAAVAAIVKSVNPDLSPLGIAGLLADTSVDLLPTGRDEKFGYGRVDAYAAAVRASETVGKPTGLVMQAGSKWEYGVPVEQQFDIGYVPGGQLTLKVGSDDDLDGNLKETGEYYGELTTNVTFDGPYHEVEIAVDRQ